MSTQTVSENKIDSPSHVIAIDFGSYASGFVVQRRTDFERDRLYFRENTNWAHGDWVGPKTRTALLLKPDKSLCEFGFAAEKKFSTINTDENEDGENWHFFRDFKMILYHEGNTVDSNTTVEDIKGRHLPATLVFGRSIQYLKEHAISCLKQDGFAFQEEKIKWVVTVPAIWTDRAKSLMRDAATKVAGIPDNNLAIALEPECAAIYCSQLSKSQLGIKSKDAEVRYITAPGSIIMVVDIGGGTVDITTVRVSEGGSMEHVHMSTGGPAGGMNFDHMFFEMLKDLVGPDVMDEFVSKNDVENFDLRTDLEKAKREFKHPGELNSGKDFQVRFPAPLKKLWERKEKMKLRDILQRKDIQERGIRFANSRLYFSHTQIGDIFDQCCKEILKSINRALSHQNMKGVQLSAIIAVGGFSMSSYVIEALRQGLSDKGIPVVRPEDAERAVMKGAALFGHKEDIIYSRILPRTYGMSCVMEFNERHSSEHKFENDSKVWANNCFRKHVTRGQTVKLGQRFDSKEYYPEDDSQTSVTILVFASEKTDPIHTTEEGCSFAGKFDVTFPIIASDDTRKRAVQVALQFGGTELQVIATSNDGTAYREWLRY